MAQHTVNVAGDKHEFDPKWWTAAADQNGASTYQNGHKTYQNGITTHARLPKRDPETGINVLIVGAGMGGLMSTLECWRKGHNIVGILERNEGPVYSGSRHVAMPRGKNISS